MRHGLTKVLTLAAVSLVSELTGFSQAALGEDFLDDRLGIRAAPILLLMRKDVQYDLKLDEDQRIATSHAGEALYRQALALKGKSGPGIVAARREIDEQQSQWLATHLTSAQLERLGEIDLQWEGPSAMIHRPMVLEALKLNEAQKKSIARLVEARAVAVSNRRPWTMSDHAAITQKALGVLNEKQRGIWLRLIGQQCKFSVVPVLVAAPPPAMSQPVKR